MITTQAASNVVQRKAGIWLVSLLLLAPVMAAGEITMVMAPGASFKRVKVSDMVPGKRITVQIDPVEQARLLAAMPKVEPHEPTPPPDAVAGATGPAGMPAATPAGTKYAWFWDQVPTQIDQPDGRLPTAIAALSMGPGGTNVRAPRLQDMQTIAQNYGTEILKATIGTDVSPALALAVIGVESAGAADAVSSAGAQGLMQLIPDTAKRFGVADSSDPAENIKGGVAYLDWLMKNFNHDPIMVIAAYNAGEGAVTANAGVPPYAETRDYVPKVLAAWQVAQGLCLSPPELMSDPCVFNVLSASN